MGKGWDGRGLSASFPGEGKLLCGRQEEITANEGRDPGD